MLTCTSVHPYFPVANGEVQMGALNGGLRPISETRARSSAIPLCTFVAFWLDIFETPVTVTPRTGNFKNFEFFLNSLKILNVYFRGDNVCLLGQ